MMCPLCYAIDHEASSPLCPSNIQKQKEKEMMKTETGAEMTLPSVHLSPISFDEFKEQYLTFYRSLNPSFERTTRAGIKYSVYCILSGVYSIPKMCIDPKTNHVVWRMLDDKHYIAIGVKNFRSIQLLTDEPIPDCTCMIYMFIPQLPELSNLPKPGATASGKRDKNTHRNNKY